MRENYFIAVLKKKEELRPHLVMLKVFILKQVSGIDFGTLTFRDLS